MSDTKGIAPPSAGDLLRAAEGYGWPPLTVAGFTIAGGETAWRSHVAALSPEQRAAIWAEDWPCAEPSC